MKTKRAMMLVSTDPESIRLGASELLKSLKEALEAYQLTGRSGHRRDPTSAHSNILPFVVVYPEASVYGPVKPGDARYLVEEHLYKGRIRRRFACPAQRIDGTDRFAPRP
jgi:hypothetical protein